MLNNIIDKFKIYQTMSSFGTTSAIITNLGLIVGLHSGTNAKVSIIGGILIIAIADNISDSFGIHIFRESENAGTKEVWISTILNFISRFIVSLSFVALILLLPLNIAIMSSIILGLILLAMLSYLIAKDKSVNPFSSVFMHLLTAIIVIIISNLAGDFLISRFK